MCSIKDAWTHQRLEYQLRYVKACEMLNSIQHQNDTDFYKGKSEDAMLEMSWVLISIFGLTCKSKEIKNLQMQIMNHRKYSQYCVR